MQSVYSRENLLTARLDYNISEDKKIFVRLGYDNANLVGPQNSQSMWRNQINVPSAAVGLDWNRGRFVNSARFGYQKLVNAITPDLADSASAPFHMQLGSVSLGPTTAGPRQTVQQDLFARYDSSTIYKVNHAIRFGGAFHHILQNDYYALGSYGPSVTSSNGIATIGAINGNPVCCLSIPATRAARRTIRSIIRSAQSPSTTAWEISARILRSIAPQAGIPIIDLKVTSPTRLT